MSYKMIIDEMNFAVVCLVVLAAALPCDSEGSLVERQAREIYQDPRDGAYYYQNARNIRQPPVYPSSSFVPYPLTTTAESVYVHPDEAAEGGVLDPDFKRGDIGGEINTKSTDLEFYSNLHLNFDAIIDPIVRFISKFNQPLARLIQKFREKFAHIRLLTKPFWSLIKKFLHPFRSLKQLLQRPQPENMLAQVPLPVPNLRQKRDLGQVFGQGLQGVLQNEPIIKTLISSGLNLLPGFIQNFPEMLRDLQNTRGPAQIILFIIEASVKFVTFLVSRQSPLLTSISQFLNTVWKVFKPFLMPFFETVYNSLSGLLKDIVNTSPQKLNQAPNYSYNEPNYSFINEPNYSYNVPNYSYNE